MRRPLATAWFGPALWAAAKLRVAAWDRLVRSPRGIEEVQRKILAAHLATAADTEFGRAHDFAHIKSYEDFRARVPLRVYGDFEADLTRMRQGAENVLWPGLIKYYGQSSGSSNTAALHKFLPISMQQIRWQQKAAFDLASRYVTLSGDLMMPSGYHLALLPPAKLRMEGQVGVASNPGIMQLHLPLAARPVTLPTGALREIADYDQKMQAIAEAYLDHDVRALTGTTCWFTILFDRLLAVAKARGRKESTVGELWPNLRVLFGGGIPAEPYRPIIAQRVGRKLVLIDNYNATEGGIFAATDRLDDDGLLMIPDRGVFFELVPRGEEGKPNPIRVPLWAVEPEVDYSVVVTTCSGLFAYVIGDYVRFKSVLPHRLRFSGRTSGVLSLTQELTTHLELEQAVAEAKARHDATVVDFAAAAEVGVSETGKGRYVLLVEFDRQPADLGGFLADFDRRLAELNRIYREHRDKNVAIMPPALVPLRSGATREFMAAMGRTSVQNKFPRTVDDRGLAILRTYGTTTVEGRV
jgi:hypothetical protein